MNWADDFQARLDAAGKGVTQKRMNQALQTAALRDSRTHCTRQAEQANYNYLRACEDYLGTINWYRQRLEERERFREIHRAA